MLDTLLKFATSAIPIGAGIYGQERTNAANAAQAQKQMDFQERMAGSSYQRAVADLRAAGLNPALAYQQGGATAPSGSSAQMGNSIAAGAAGAQAALQAYLNIQQMRANVEKTRAETQNLTQQWNITGNMAPIQKRLLLLTEELKTFERNEGSQRNAQLIERIGLELDQLRADLAATQTHAREIGLRGDLLDLDKPRAENEARAERMLYRKYFSRHVNDASGLLRDITAYRRLGARSGQLTSPVEEPFDLREHNERMIRRAQRH